jgi:hypothetical protein
VEFQERASNAYVRYWNVLPHCQCDSRVMTSIINVQEGVYSCIIWVIITHF